MNLLIWSAQAATVILVAAAIAKTLRAAPRIRLVLWQLALVSALLLPLIRPWQSEVITFAAISHTASAVLVPAAPPATPVASSLSPLQLLMLLLAGGVAIRLALLATGLIRLRSYRRNACRYAGDVSWSVEASLLTSDEIASPVTFGFFRPVILLPGHFADLAGPMRDTILYHEILHVRRNDWLFAVAEETVRAILWFHPAIWWAVREIQLAREETVDREVVETLNARDTYVDALLAIAGSPIGAEMVVAPLFLRRRHLKRRVISIFQEVRMSKTRSVSALIAGCAALALSCWFITGAIPLKAAPQEVIDGVGVAVDIGGAHLMHRSSVTYPRDAYLKGVQGVVTAQVKLDSAGNVVDASIASGPDELRKTVLQSVLNWHFTGDSANSTRQITVGFTRSPGAPAPVTVTLSAPSGGLLGGIGGTLRPAPPAGAIAARIGSSAPLAPIKDIVVQGLPDAARDELLSKLPVHAGDTMTAETSASLALALHNFDEHLTLATRVNKDGEVTLEIRAPGSFGIPAPPPAPGIFEPRSITSTTKAVLIGPGVMAGNLISQAKPEYPPLARAARIQGDVQFDAVIGKDGKVAQLHLLEGPPLLAQAAMKAVQDWIYKPTVIDGQPVDVNTRITVSFVLPQ